MNWISPCIGVVLAAVAVASAESDDVGATGAGCTADRIAEWLRLPEQELEEVVSPEALRAIIARASEGDPKAQALAGRCKLVGVGGASDPEAAVVWFRGSADAGEPEGEVSIGQCYYYGTWVTQDLRCAAQWFMRAAEDRHAQAWEYLGLLSLRGEISGKPDPGAAANWFNLAASRGLPQSAHNLARLYAQGLGVAKDLEKAAQLYQQAAEKGYPPSQFNLGRIYSEGVGRPKDLRQTFRWYREAARQNFAPALYNLGVMYENGIGVPANAREAARHYRGAAELGDPKAQYNLAVLLIKGDGIRDDPVEATRWLKASAAQGDAYAKRALEDIGVTEPPPGMAPRE